MFHQILAQATEMTGSTITVSIGSVIGLSILWKVAQWVKGINDRLDDITKSMWTVRNQERFASKIHCKNRACTLFIPDPAKIAEQNSIHGEDSDSGFLKPE